MVNAVWFGPCYAVFNPDDDGLHKLLTDCAGSGQRLEEHFCTDSGHGDVQHIKPVRKTVCSGYCVQFTPNVVYTHSAAARVRPWGRGKMALYSIASKCDCQLGWLQGSSCEIWQFCGEQNLAGASLAWSGCWVCSQQCTPSRCARVLPTWKASVCGLVATSTMSTSEPWAPSISVRLTTEPDLVKQILMCGAVILDYYMHEVWEFSVPVATSFHCGTLGHTTKYCWGHCARFGAQHPSHPCPLMDGGNGLDGRSGHRTHRNDTERIWGIRVGGKPTGLMLGISGWDLPAIKLNDQSCSLGGISRYRQLH